MERPGQPLTAGRPRLSGKLKSVFLDLQGTTAPTSATAPTLRPAPAAQARPPRVRPQPHEREEAALGAGGELGGNHMGTGEQ